MASQSSNESKEDNLNDSWVEFSDVSSTERCPSSTNKPPPSPASSSVVRLLIEAQKDSSSCHNSGASGHGSPTSCHSTLGSEMIEGVSQVDSDLCETSWIQQWSSRPEIIPPSETVLMRDPSHCRPVRRHWLSIRNTAVMRGVVFVTEHLPLLIVSHACSFILGAITMALYMRKYGRMATSPVNR